MKNCRVVIKLLAKYELNCPVFTLNIHYRTYHHSNVPDTDKANTDDISEQ